MLKFCKNLQDAKFLVCKHQLSHVSDYFRTLFSASNRETSPFDHNSPNEFAVVVSSLKNPSPVIQFKWFLECTIRNAFFGDITGEHDKQHF